MKSVRLEYGPNGELIPSDLVSKGDIGFGPADPRGKRTLYMCVEEDPTTWEPFQDRRAPRPEDDPSFIMSETLVYNTIRDLRAENEELEGFLRSREAECEDYQRREHHLRAENERLQAALEHHHWHLKQGAQCLTCQA